MLLKEQRYFLKEPNKRLSTFLAALGLDSQAFLDPNGQCLPIIPDFNGLNG